MKIILITSAVGYALILIIGYFWKGHWDGALPLLSIFVVFYFFILVTLLPAQALTAVSSKSLRYLVDFRKFYFVVAFLLAFIFPLMMNLALVCVWGLVVKIEATKIYYE